MISGSGQSSGCNFLPEKKQIESIDGETSTWKAHGIARGTQG